MITHLFIDFDGVLTDNFVYVDSDGKETVRCSRSDGMGIEKIKEAGVQVLILSSEMNEVVSKRADKLELPCARGLGDKEIAMKSICRDLSKAAFIGNDLNDLEAMEACGIAIAVADARKEIRDIADYVTKARGGCGAVREACGWLMTRK